MKYPSGCPIKIGDDVIFDEGEAFGYVLNILESELDYKSYGLDCESLILGLVYPKSDWAFTSYPEHIFIREGLRLQSYQDVLKIQEIIEKARHLVDFESAKCTKKFAISFSIRKNSSQEDKGAWKINIFRDHMYYKTVCI